MTPPPVHRFPEAMEHQLEHQCVRRPLPHNHAEGVLWSCPSFPRTASTQTTSDLLDIAFFRFCCLLHRVLFIHSFTFRNLFIAATEFERLPGEPQRRRSAVSLAPYSPLPGGPQTQPRCKRKPSGRAGQLSNALHLLPHRCTAVYCRRHKARPAPPSGRGHRDRPEPRIHAASRWSQSSLRRSAVWPIFAPAYAANQPPACRLRLYWQLACDRLIAAGR